MLDGPIAHRPGAATASRFTYLLIQGGASVLVFAALARTLDADALGGASAALAAYVLAQTVGDMGLTHVATVEIPRAHAEGRSAADSLAAHVARLFWRGAAAAILVTGTLALLAPSEARTAVLAVAPAAGCALLVSGAESLRRAAGDYRAPLVLVAWGRLPFFALIPLIQVRPTATWSMVLFSTAAVIGVLPAARILTKAEAARQERRGASNRTLLHGAALIGAVGVLIAAATRGNALIFAQVASLAEVGQYEAAWRGVQPFVYAAGALGTGLTPIASTALAEGRRLRTLAGPGLAISVVLGLVGALVCFVGSEPLSKLLYGSADAGAADALRVLSAGLPFSVAAFYVQTAVLLPQRRYRLLLAGGGAMALVTLAATAPLGFEFGAAGCAAALTAGQIAYAVTLAFGLLRVRERAAGALRKSR